MGYALFAQRKVQLTGQLNSVSLQQTQRSNEQFLLATQTLSLQQKMTSLQTAQATDLADLYALLSISKSDGGFDFDSLSKQKENGESLSEYDRLKKVLSQYGLSDNSDRDSVNAKIKEEEQKNQQELDAINREIYLVSIKEQAVEMQVKRLDTQISSLQKQLEAVEDAEGSAIDRATPKFKGVA